MWVHEHNFHFPFIASFLPTSIDLQVKNKDDAFSTLMHTFCSNPDRPICILRGLCSALELNIDIFSSAYLANFCPDHHMEIRDQVRHCCRLASVFVGGGGRLVLKH